MSKRAAKGAAKGSQKVRVSCEFGAGTYQWEWRDDKIAIVEWDKPPTSTGQWLTIEKGGRYRLEGTCNDDIRVVRLAELAKGGGE